MSCDRRCFDLADDYYDYHDCINCPGRDEKYFYPDAIKWMWNYCIPLGKWISSIGKEYDLGVYIYPKPLEHNMVSEASVFGNTDGDYYSGEILHKDEPESWVWNSERRQEVLKRYLAYLDAVTMEENNKKEDGSYG